MRKFYGQRRRLVSGLVPLVLVYCCGDPRPAVISAPLSARASKTGLRRSPRRASESRISFSLAADEDLEF